MTSDGSDAFEVVFQRPRKSDASEYISAGGRSFIGRKFYFSRAGVEPLGVGGFLSAEGKPFEFVLLAEEDTGIPGNRAIIRTGPKGEERFLKLMGSNDSP